MPDNEIVFKPILNRVLIELLFIINRVVNIVQFCWKEIKMQNIFMGERSAYLFKNKALKLDHENK
jgi:hypothetical protein